MIVEEPEAQPGPSGLKRKHSADDADSGVKKVRTDIVEDGDDIVILWKGWMVMDEQLVKWYKEQMCDDIPVYLEVYSWSEGEYCLQRVKNWWCPVVDQSKTGDDLL